MSIFAGDPAPTASATAPAPRRPASKPARVPVKRKIGWAWYALTALAIAVVAPLPYLTGSLSELAESGQGLAQHYDQQPAWIQWTLIVHAATGGVAMALVPFQLLRPLRRRYPKAHRVTGRVLVGVILAAASAGLVIAQVSYAGWVGRVGFSMLALAWGTSAVLAARSAISGDGVAHRAWTIRVAALTYAAVTLRLWVGLWIGIVAPQTEAATQAAFDDAYLWQPFMCWVPNLLIAEWIIRRSGSTRRP